MKPEIKWLLFGIIAVGFIMLASGKKKSNATDPEMPVEVADSPNAGFYAPFYQTNPGIVDSSVNGNGNPPYVREVVFNPESTIQQYFNINPMGSLSHEYMPTFGFVGVVAA